MDVVEKFITAVRGTPFVLKNEKAVQDSIETLLGREGICFAREVRLNEEDVPDFVIDGKIAVEVKIKGQPREIFRQCERYCKHDSIEALILVTAKTMGLPGEIEGKPCYYVSLSQAWL